MQALSVLYHRRFKSVTQSECYSTAVLIYSSPSLPPVHPCRPQVYLTTHVSCSPLLSHPPSSPILPFPGVCLMDWCYYLDLLHASVFKGGRWLYLSSFSMFKRHAGLCGAEVAVWGKLGGNKWAWLVGDSGRFKKFHQKHHVWTVNQNNFEMDAEDKLILFVSLKKRSRKTPI